MKDHESLPMIPIRRGSGAWLEDFDGKRYLDAVSSWWVNLFGHANPRINAALTARRINIICLAGYMRLLTPYFVNQWSGRMLNIHPSLLPAYPGLNTHARALAAGEQTHGCTVHLVTETMDEGPILAQASVPVLPGDTEATLAARVLAREHEIYPAALAEFARTYPLPSPEAGM